MSAYTLDDLQVDISDLHNQLTAIRDILHEMDYGTGETRNHELDRVAAMNRIADDMAGRIVSLVDGNYHNIRVGEDNPTRLRALARKMSEATQAMHKSPDPLLQLIEEHNRAKVALSASRQDGSPEEKVFWKAYKLLSENPPTATTREGVIEAIRLVVHEEKTCAGQEELTVNLLSAALGFFETSEAEVAQA